MNFSFWMQHSFWTQYFPPSPTFTEKDVPNQSGKVFIVTGGNSGIGLELIKFLYPTGATIYMASRSKERAEIAIQQVISKNPESAKCTPGVLKFLHLDLNDLTTIKASAASFAAQESRLDILWNNAGIGGSPIGTSTKQKIEGHIGVNCVAPLLFTQELIPQLRAAASNSPPNSVRIIWTSSLSMETHAPQGGIDFSLISSPSTQNPAQDYAASKTGNYFLALETARRYGDSGITSVAQNPGQLATDVWKYQSGLVMAFIKPTLYEKKFGAYALLYSGFSQDLGVGTGKRNGVYVMPWGRIMDMEKFPRKDILSAIEGGAAERFWEWCEEQWKIYV